MEISKTHISGDKPNAVENTPSSVTGKSSENVKGEQTKKGDEKGNKAGGSFGKRFLDFAKARFCNETEVIGVEIQADCIRICQTSKTEKGKWCINKLDSASVVQSNSYDSLANNKKLYVSVLKDLFKKNSISNKNVAICLPTSMCIVQSASLPLMPAENLAKATKIQSFWQSLIQFSGDIKDYSIFYQIISEDAENKEMDILFAACKNEDIDVFSGIIEGAGLNIVVVDVACFSINNLSKLKADGDDLIDDCFLKIGKDENYLQILDEGKPYIYDIFVAENEKSYLGEYLDHQTFQQRFTSQLKHIISKHEDKFGKKIGSLKIISSEVKISCFIENMKLEMKDVDIQNSNLFGAVKIPKKIAEKHFADNPSRWAAVAGLATREIDIFQDPDKNEVSENINLLPDADNILIDLKASFYSKIIIGLVLAVCLVVALAYGGITYSVYQGIIVETKDFNKMNKEYLSLKDDFDKVNIVSGNLNKLIKTREGLNSNQQDISDIFTYIASQIPEGVWVKEIKIINEKNFIQIVGNAYQTIKIISFSKKFDGYEKLYNVSIKSMGGSIAANGTKLHEFILEGEMRKIEPVKPKRAKKKDKKKKK